MKYSHKAALIIGALAILLTLGFAQRAGGVDPVAEETATTTEEVSRETEIIEPKEEVKDVPRVTDDREEWLEKLVQCESRGNPEAVNPKDRDGTPSYGLLQFKPSTFEFFSKAYGIEGDLMDPEAQKAIVRRMMDDPSVRWENQFPDCVKIHIGWPPGVLR